MFYYIRTKTDQSDRSIGVEYFSTFHPNIIPLVLGMLIAGFFLALRDRGGILAKPKMLQGQDYCGGGRPITGILRLRPGCKAGLVQSHASDSKL